jgi:hypothetical protein
MRRGFTTPETYGASTGEGLDTLEIARRLEPVLGPLLQAVQHRPLERHRKRRRDL